LIEELGFLAEFGRSTHGALSAADLPRFHVHDVDEHGFNSFSCSFIPTRALDHENGLSPLSKTLYAGIPGYGQGPARKPAGAGFP
jgi:hypothetical protein